MANQQPTPQALRPEAAISVTIKGETTRVLMTAGRRALCATYITDVESVATFYIDAVTQQAVLTELLRERDAYGHPKVLLDAEGKEVYPAYDSFELSLEDHELLVDWVARHVNAFFINGLLAYSKSADEQRVAAEALQPKSQTSAPSQTGTPISEEMKPSVGATTAA